MCLGLALSSKLILHKVRVLHLLLLGCSCFCLPSKNKQWHEKNTNISLLLRAEKLLPSYLPE